jgi:hypothetical protein
VRWRHDSEAAIHTSSWPVRPTSLMGLCLMVLATAVSCDSAGVASSTSLATEMTPPAEVAATVLTAVLEGDSDVAADWTLLDQMPWVAMAEGASIQQAVALLEEGARLVAINYWQGFSEGTGLPDLEVGAVQESEVGTHSFASVIVGSGGRLRIVLRMEDRWLVDVVASFGSTLAERLRDAIDIIAANRGPDADRLKELISQQRDSISVALESSNLNESARQSLEELGAAIDVLGS